MFPADFPYRLGYACQNTVLRKYKDEKGKTVETFCSRTTRLANAEKNPEVLKSLALQNLKDLETLILWNEKHGIRFMRMSSDMFPFASHGTVGYDLLFAKDELERIGKLAKSLNHRLTTHPGQTNNLGSPKESVIQATIRDLTYHAQMIDLMQLDCDSVMIIHGGGVYEGQKEALERFESNFLKLPENVRNRLVLENDEICYSTESLLPMCEKLQIPIVFDWHHHALNPGSIPLEEILSRVKAIWKQRGIRQKMHYSESREGAVTLMQRRAHSDYVKDIPMCGNTVDLMIEAKMKEQNVLLMMQKYNL